MKILKCAESLPHKWTHKPHTSINLQAPWIWSTAAAETCWSNN